MPSLPVGPVVPQPSVGSSAGSQLLPHWAQWKWGSCSPSFPHGTLGKSKRAALHAPSHRSKGMGGCQGYMGCEMAVGARALIRL